MVVKINGSAASVRTSLEYNQSKVTEGHASVVLTHKIDDPSKPMETFERYENASIRTEKLSFHLSINPSKDDNMSEEKVKEFAKELMDKLGYGNQPYMVFRHNDIGREHYHVVSVRVDERGRKINDSYEKQRCEKIIRTLSKKYGFTVGCEKGIGKATNPYLGFDREKGDCAAQIESISKLAMGYHFKKPEDYVQLMRYFGVGVEMRKKKRGKVEMAFYGIDKKTGKRCTDYFMAKNNSLPSLDEVVQHTKECRASESKDKAKEKLRVHNLVCYCLDRATSEKHFRNMLRKHGISMKINVTSVEKTLVDATFIDTKTKCVFSVKDMKGRLNGLSLDRIAEARQNWPDRWESQWENLHKEPSVTTKTVKTMNRVYGSILSERSRRHEDEEIMMREDREVGHGQ